MLYVMKELLLILALCCNATGIRFVVAGWTPAFAVKEVFVPCWLKSDGTGDFNGDGRCDMGDYNIFVSDMEMYMDLYVQLNVEE
jgi:hypothetical protein